MPLEVILGLVLPFLGTTIGASMVLFLRKSLNNKVQKALLGFAGGVMIAASVWSLIITAIEMSTENGDQLPWLPAAVGFLLGIFFLLILDMIIPHLHLHSDEVEGIKGKKSLKKSTMLVLAVTLHNIPEGMAVGVLLAAIMNGDMTLMSGAVALSVGIALQNLPEGAITSMPLLGEGYSKPKAFLLGTLSGIVEPIAALITILLVSVVTPILPYLLAFAAGAMIYVVVEELIPEAQEGKHSNIATIALAIGFVLMMILDVALG